MTGDFSATKLFHHETIFNFHWDNFGTIVENKADFFLSTISYYFQEC